MSVGLNATVLFANTICKAAVADEGPRSRRAAHESSAGSPPCAERKRRGAHGASAVCAAIGATMPMDVKSAGDFLFDENTVGQFRIKFV